MTPDEAKAAILDFITDEINLEEVVNVEHQLGNCWIDLADGTTKVLMLTDCEPM
jgi:coenzyme F420-reducing hydrogenase beta subunit